MNRASRSSRAFTLIELLVVIAIIALVISVLLPALSGARERSKSVVCRTQLRELVRCALLYQNDFSTYPPCIDNYIYSGLDTNRAGLDWLGVGDQFGAFVLGTPGDPNTGNPRGFVDAPRWGLFNKYTTQPERIVMCPSDTGGPYVPNEIVPPGNGRFSYAMVAGMGLRTPERIPADVQVRGTSRNPSNAPIFVEEHPDGINNQHKEGNFWGGVQPPADGGDTLVSRHAPFTNRLGVRPNDGGVTMFRQGETNVGFADGHVEGLKTNFGFGRTLAAQHGIGTYGNNVTGLLYTYGIKYELLKFVQ